MRYTSDQRFESDFQLSRSAKRGPWAFDYITIFEAATLLTGGEEKEPPPAAAVNLILEAIDNGNLLILSKQEIGDESYGSFSVKHTYARTHSDLVQPGTLVDPAHVHELFPDNRIFSLKLKDARNPALIAAQDGPRRGAPLRKPSPEIFAKAWVSHRDSILKDHRPYPDRATRPRKTDLEEAARLAGLYQGAVPKNAIPVKAVHAEIEKLTAPVLPSDDSRQ